MEEALAKVKREFPQADTTKFLSHLDEKGRIIVSLGKLGKNSKWYRPILESGKRNTSLPKAITKALGLSNSEILESADAKTTQNKAIIREANFVLDDASATEADKTEARERIAKAEKENEGIAERYQNPIRDPKWISLHSAAVPLVRVLKEEGEIRSENEILLTIPTGEYTLDTAKTAIDTATRVGKQPTQIVGHTLLLQPGRTANKASGQLLAIPESAEGLRLPISWSRPETLWIHCDLVDVDSVLTCRTSAVRTTIARRADIIGGISQPRGNRLTYSTLSPVRIKARTVSQVHALYFRVADERGALIVLHNNSLHNNSLHIMLEIYNMIAFITQWQATLFTLSCPVSPNLQAKTIA
ncbi:hypothetical protein QZH41_002128 [Actinostola sp. cb2023]|nr:hypothetical protein QZH41_002128 [Actinostola sp. cb2023]